MVLEAESGQIFSLIFVCLADQLEAAPELVHLEAEEEILVCFTVTIVAEVLLELRLDG